MTQQVTSTGNTTEQLAISVGGRLPAFRLSVFGVKQETEKLNDETHKKLLERTGDKIATLLQLI